MNPFFLRAKKTMTGKMNPNTNAVKIKTKRFNKVGSSLNAKIEKTIIVKAGGTNSVDIILAVFIEKRLVNFKMNDFNNPRLKQQLHNFSTAQDILIKCLPLHYNQPVSLTLVLSARHCTALLNIRYKISGAREQPFVRL